MELILNISEVAIITGDNQYKTKREYLIDFWKKNAKEDFLKYKELTKFVKETDDDVIKKITYKNNIDITLELNKCIKSGNTTDLNNAKKDILTKMDNLNETEKKEITKSLDNVTNTRFGIKNENDITKIYETMIGSTIIKDNKYRKIQILESNECKIYIGGKIDGFNSDKNIIVEIKNRVNKLFYTLRNYEKVQIMCYMYLFNIKMAHLVEAFKKKDGTEINVIDVPFEKDYMEYILDKIIEFSKFFCKFIKDHDAKLNLLNSNDEIIFI